MKKLLLAGLFAASASMSVSATVVDFDDSAFNNGAYASGVTFDDYDLAVGVGSVTQVGPNFTETGTLAITNFNLGLNPVMPNGFPGFKGYELLMDYTLGGTAGLVAPNQLKVTFNSGTAALYADTTIDGSTAGATLLGNLSVSSGVCNVFTDAPGSCGIRMGFVPVSGFFSMNGVDLVDHQAAGAGIWFDFTMTVQNIVGLNFTGTPFDVNHDGNVSVSVPEPTSIAILGLGLLGFAGTRRRKS